MMHLIQRNVIPDLHHNAVVAAAVVDVHKVKDRGLKVRARDHGRKVPVPKVKVKDHVHKDNDRGRKVKDARPLVVLSHQSVHAMMDLALINIQVHANLEYLYE